MYSAFLSPLFFRLLFRLDPQLTGPRNGTTLSRAATCKTLAASPYSRYPCCGQRMCGSGPAHSHEEQVLLLGPLRSLGDWNTSVSRLHLNKSF